MCLSSGIINHSGLTSGDYRLYDVVTLYEQNGSLYYVWDQIQHSNCPCQGPISVFPEKKIANRDYRKAHFIYYQPGIWPEGLSYGYRYKPTKRLVRTLLGTLNQLSLNAVLVHGRDIHQYLRQAVSCCFVTRYSIHYSIISGKKIKNALLTPQICLVYFYAFFSLFWILFQIPTVNA